MAKVRGTSPGSLAPRPRQGERRPGLRALGAAAAPVAAPVIARAGGGVLARLKAHWGEIVGAELAAATWPESLGRDRSLRLRVAPAAALAVQHRTPLVIERINLFFGRDAVGRITLVQAPLPLPPPAAPPGRRDIPAAESAGLDRSLADIADDELRAALGRLGRAVIGAENG
jgi:hypothetical protein